MQIMGTDYYITNEHIMQCVRSGRCSMNQVYSSAVMPLARM